MAPEALTLGHRGCTADLAGPGMEVGMYINQNNLTMIDTNSEISQKKKAASVRLMDVGPFVRQEGRHPPLTRDRARRLEEINRIREEFGFTRQIAGLSGQGASETAPEGSLWTNWLMRHFSASWTVVRADHGK